MFGKIAGALDRQADRRPQQRRQGRHPRLRRGRAGAAERARAGRDRGRRLGRSRNCANGAAAARRRLTLRTRRLRRFRRLSRFLEIGLDLALELDRHRLAVAVAAAPGQRPGSSLPRSQYSSTLVFSWPLKRMPTPRRSSVLVEIAGCAGRATGGRGACRSSAMRGALDAAAAPGQPVARRFSTNGGRRRCHVAQRRSQSCREFRGRVIAHAPLRLLVRRHRFARRRRRCPAGADAAGRAAASRSPAQAEPMTQAKPEGIAARTPTGGKKDQKWDVNARHGPGPRRADRRHRRAPG